MSTPRPEAESRPSSTLDLAMLSAAAERLSKRWRKIAAHLEPYAPPAAKAYEQAAAELEAEIEQHGTRMDAMAAFRDEIVVAVRRSRQGP
ncbi:MAG: hypothetical protein AB1941_08530 [Gemmatimonadota bacterium]